MDRKNRKRNSRQGAAFSFREDSVVGVDADRIPVGSLEESESGVGESTDEHVVLVESAKERDDGRVRRRKGS